MSSEDSAYQAAGTGARVLELLEGAEHYNRWLYSWIEPHLGAVNCELGAGHGTLTRFALEHHRVLATEPSTAGRDEIQKRFNEHPRLLGVERDFLEVARDGSVDCVYSANVLEHIADDVAILEHAARVLKPGGRFIAVVPAGAWLYSNFDAIVGHYRRYGGADRTRLTVMLRERGIPLALTTFSYRNPIGAFGWLLSMRLFQNTTVPPDKVRAVERLVPFLRHLDRLELPFGQSLVVGLVRQ